MNLDSFVEFLYFLLVQVFSVFFLTQLNTHMMSHFYSLFNLAIEFSGPFNQLSPSSWQTLADLGKFLEKLFSIKEVFGFFFSVFIVCNHFLERNCHSSVVCVVGLYR